MSALAELRGAVLDAATELGGGTAPAGALTLERPPRADFGDYSTNAALLLAGKLGRPPREVAQQLGELLAARLAAGLDRFDVAGPGFVNLHLADAWLVGALDSVLSAGDAFGAGGASSRRRIDIEFVSANPTGPLTAASGRHAAYGDALARILALHGHDVQREYYVNDHGSQVMRLAESIRARATGAAVPEDGYQGDYVATLVDPADVAKLDDDALARAGAAACLRMIRATLERIDVRFDTWFSERSLHEGDPSAVDAELAELERRGDAYRSEGALWLRTTAHGDDKDRVLVRSSGEHTYFASDVAYHRDKLARGFDLLIDVWGADHHGYVARMRAALAALGAEPEVLEPIILQFVHLVEGGGRASMSKRRGEFVTLDELVDEIGADATRWFLVARSHDTTVELDLDLARAQRADNPVYYVQYAHARIASILARATPQRVQEAARAAPPADLELHPAERALVKAILAFETEVAEAAQRRAPHRIAAYALALAQEFTAFYRDCHILGAQPHELESLRLRLALAARDTIARALGLLGVSAPESM